jgi:phosphatidylserine decarboxylase
MSTTVPDVTPELPSSTWRVLLTLLGRLPARAMSRGFGRVADVALPRPLRRAALGAFARATGIDLAEAELPLEEYGSLNEFFVRRLRPGAREWPTDPEAVASPVDGIVGASGVVTAGRAIQAKGHSYAVPDLLADEEEAERYEGGAFVTIYLSPRHYHRIHTPCPGSIPRATYVPGSLLPVNGPAVMHVPGLFVRNERLLCYLDGARGRIAVVAIGAYNVGRISAAFDERWAGQGAGRGVSNRSVHAPLQRRYDPPVAIRAGGEIMAFHLGSTVVLLFERGVELLEGMIPGREVRVGERIAR